MNQEYATSSISQFSMPKLTCTKESHPYSARGKNWEGFSFSVIHDKRHPWDSHRGLNFCNKLTVLIMSPHPHTPQITSLQSNHLKMFVLVLQAVPGSFMHYHWAISIALKSPIKFSSLSILALTSNRWIVGNTFNTSRRVASMLRLFL